MKQVTNWIAAAAGLSVFSPHIIAMEPLENSRQCLVVTTDSWSASKGVMSILERTEGGEWQPRRRRVAVVVGKTGLAWGRGLFEKGSLAGPQKKEGDSKAPAGIFQLSRVFGYARAAETKMPYLGLSANIVGVDDPRSAYYNQLVDQAKVQPRDWRTAEQMFRPDGLYKWGVVVEHNSPPQPGAGSCIFLHVWRGPDKPTIGCTAMAEPDLLEIVHWLDPGSHPLLVQLPQPMYKQLRQKWHLPQLR